MESNQKWLTQIRIQTHQIRFNNNLKMSRVTQDQNVVLSLRSTLQKFNSVPRICGVTSPPASRFAVRHPLHRSDICLLIHMNFHNGTSGQHECQMTSWSQHEPTTCQRKHQWPKKSGAAKQDWKSIQSTRLVTVMDGNDVVATCCIPTLKLDFNSTDKDKRSILFR